MGAPEVPTALVVGRKRKRMSRNLLGILIIRVLMPKISVRNILQG